MVCGNEKQGYTSSLTRSLATGGALTAAAALCTVWTASAAHAGDLSKIAPDLAASLQPAPVSATGKNKFALLSAAAASVKTSKDAEPRFRVIVRMKTPVDNTVTTHNVRMNVAVLGRTFKSTNSAVVEATPSQLVALSNDPSVASISPDRAVMTTADLDVDRRATGVDVAGQALPTQIKRTGQGINIAVLDSGVVVGGDIASNSVVGFKDFVNNQTTAYDDYGHGTHVTGIIVGNGNASAGAYKGIAPSSKIVALKVLGSNGSGQTSNILAAIDWVIANKTAYKIRIINMSLSTGVWESYKTDPLCQAAEKAVHAGITVVAAAGNIGGVYGAVGAPANDPLVIAVGASNSRGTVGRGDDVIASFSSRGPSRFDLSIKPDVIAPGNNIVSVRAPGSFLDTNYPQTQVPTSEYTTSGGTSAYTRLSGTSMASPMVAAAAALILQTNGALYPNAVKSALMYSAEPLTGYDPVRQATVVYDPLTQGAGELNIPGACETANLMKPNGLSSNPSLVSQIGGADVVWLGAKLPSLLVRSGGVGADNLIWGGHIDYVPQPKENTVWGSNLIWGGHIDFKDEMVWGANLIWGGHIDNAKPYAQDPPDTSDMIWANQALWGKATQYSSGAPDDGVVNANNLIWGGHIDFQGDSNDPTANNLIWGGHIDAANLIWGGHIDVQRGDDTANPYPGNP